VFLIDLLCVLHHERHENDVAPVTLAQIGDTIRARENPHARIARQPNGGRLFSIVLIVFRL